MKSPATAETGKCIGITTTDKVFCDRGYIFSNPGDTPVVTHQFRANIFWMDKLPYKKGQTGYFPVFHTGIPLFNYRYSHGNRFLFTGRNQLK